jgi:hypothetical protein
VSVALRPCNAVADGEMQDASGLHSSVIDADVEASCRVLEAPRKSSRMG